MTSPIFLIETDSTPADASIRRFLSAGLGVEYRPLSWDALPSAGLDADVHAGVLAVAVPFTAVVAAVFEAWSNRPIGGPTLAVLPADAGESVVRLAAGTADDFMFSPVREPELRERVKRLFGPTKSEVDGVRERLLEELGMAQLIGRDPVFLKALAQVPRFARSGLPVLITGETGTGKELCARAIHHLGPRRDAPFIAVDCGTIPEHLLENELFGHARGAYTDAHRDQRGLITMAAGGTLFLDEIDSLSLSAQGKLLRFLQERRYRSLGGERFETADLNVLAATNCDLEGKVTEKSFRDDLFHRLDVLRLNLPPLRARRGDLALLAQHFLDERARSGTTSARTIGRSALQVLSTYDWPGNVRELANVIARASIVCDGPQISAVDLEFGSGMPASNPPPVRFRAARAAAVELFERRYVEALLVKHRGNVTHAAREAGKDRRVFGRIVKRYGIDRVALARRC